MMHLDKIVNAQADGESWKTDHMEVSLLLQA